MAQPVTVPLHLEPNEASDLAVVDEPGLLEAEGWDAAYLTVLDEGRVEDSIAVLGHAAGAALQDGWSSHRLHFEADGDLRRTEDAEAIAVRDGHAWVFGSHFGRKSGPLQPRRQFVARFALAALADGLHGARPRCRWPARASACTARSTTPCGRRRSTSWRSATRPGRRSWTPPWPRATRAASAGPSTRASGDWPLNIEGAAFRPDGTLLVGLRFP
jgi:hypothetical protein